MRDARLAARLTRMIHHPGKPLCHFRRGERLPASLQRRPHRPDLLGKAPWDTASSSRALPCPRGRGWQRQGLLRRGRPAGVLELGAEPADDPPPLLLRPLGVERHQPPEEFVVAQVSRKGALGPETPE